MLHFAFTFFLCVWYCRQLFGFFLVGWLVHHPFVWVWFLSLNPFSFFYFLAFLDHFWLWHLYRELIQVCPFLLSVFDEFCDCPSRAMYLLVVCISFLLFLYSFCFSFAPFFIIYYLQGGIVTAVAGYKILQNVKIGKRESFKNLPLFSRPFGILLFILFSHF